MKRKAVSTIAVAVIILVIIIVAGVGVYFLTSGSPSSSTTSTTSTTTTTTSTPASSSTTSSSTAGQKTFGFIGRLSVPYWTVQEAGFKAAAAHYGFKAQIYEPPQLETQDQINTLNLYAAQGYAGVVISPNDPGAPINAINSVVVNDHIPVITSGTDSPGSARLAFIGYSPQQLGAYAANAIIALIKQNNGGSLPSGWSVTWSEGSLASTEDVASLTVFNSTITAAGGTVIPPLLDQGSAATAESNAATAISKYGSSLYGMYGFYDYTGPAISQAVNTTSSPHKIVVLGTGLISGDIPYMNSGVMAGVVDLNEYEQGYLSGALLWNLSQSSQSGWNATLQQLIPNYTKNNSVYLTPLQFIAGSNLTAYQNNYPVVWNIITGGATTTTSSSPSATSSIITPIIGGSLLGVVHPVRSVLTLISSASGFILASVDGAGLTIKKT